MTRERGMQEFNRNGKISWREVHLVDCEEFLLWFQREIAQGMGVVERIPRKQHKWKDQIDPLYVWKVTQKSDVRHFLCLIYEELRGGKIGAAKKTLFMLSG
jgi:hypothetical protein